MPPPLSAGILLYRSRDDELQVLLVHPGGPFWKNKDAGAWMIPKGGIDQGESAGDAALRELEEETGLTLGYAPAHLCKVRQAGGKIVEVFAAEGDFNPAQLRSLEFEMEWPPRSGDVQSFPEVDTARWMTLPEARRMMLPSQLPMIDALEEKLQSTRSE